MMLPPKESATWIVNEGISLRDWFAGLAMLGKMSGRHGYGSEAALAHFSYKYADAMLAEREKKAGALR